MLPGPRSFKFFVRNSVSKLLKLCTMPLCQETVQIIQGDAASGNDEQSVASCPSGMSLAGCTILPSIYSSSDGLAATSADCTATADGSTEVTAVATCVNESVAFTDVVVSGALYEDDTTLTATCPDYFDLKSCLCTSAWGVSGPCGGESAFSPINTSTCSKSVPSFPNSNRRRNVDLGYGARIFAVCTQAQGWDT